MIEHTVKDHPDTVFMACFHKRLQVLIISKP